MGEERKSRGVGSTIKQASEGKGYERANRRGDSYPMHPRIIRALEDGGVIGYVAEGVVEVGVAGGWRVLIKRGGGGGRWRRKRSWKRGRGCRRSLIRRRGRAEGNRPGRTHKHSQEEGCGNLSSAETGNSDRLSSVSGRI